MVQCGAVQYSAVQSSTVGCSLVQFSAVWCIVMNSVFKCDEVLCTVVRFNILKFCVIMRSAVQWGVVW